MYNRTVGEIRPARSRTENTSIEEALGDEVVEYAEERDVEELADVLEVVHVLREFHGLGEGRLASMRAKKADECGRFEEGIVLERVEE